MSEKESGIHVGHFPCPSCASSDNLSVYLKTDENGVDYYDGSCWTPGCEHKFWTNNELVEAGVISGEFTVDKAKLKEPKKPITKQEYEELCSRTNFSGKMKDGTQYRGLADWVLKFYGHRVERNSDGSIKAVYYPETKDNKPMGFKSRHLPKIFGKGNIGKTGITNDLSGMHKFPNGGKYVVIVGGEEDKCAAQQMFRDYQIKRNQEDYDHYAVVSPTTGEGGAAKQCAANYDWLDTFDNIVVCMDNDKAGIEAIEELVKVLPKDKVKVMKTSGKDANQMLLDGKHKQFISNFWDAKPVVSDLLKTSKEADDELEVELGRESIPLPSFMVDVERAMAGGIRLGYLVVWAAQTGGGKSTVVNEMIYHWVFNSPHKIGILSLELNAGQYQTVMLSRHIHYNINLLPTPKERLDFARQPWVIEKRKELKETEYGEPRYTMLDEREGNLETIKRQIEKMVKRDGCKVIVIDPVQDLFEGVSLEEQTSFIKWLKAFIKSGYTVIAIAHITKGKTEIDKQTGKRMMRVLTEDDLAGVSNLAKSSGCTVLMSRNKYSDDPFERNLTYPTIGKCRWSGFTGEVNPWYYDSSTHTMYDKEDYSSMIKIPVDIKDGGIDTPEF